MKDERTRGFSRVQASTNCACPFSIAESYAVDYLTSAEAGGPESVIYARLPGPFPILSRRVRMTFGLARDRTEPGRGHDEIRLRWSSESPWYPDFRGTVRFRIAGLLTEVLVEGAYRPPFGPLGALFDKLLGRRIARRSLADLAARLAEELERKEHQWRREHPVLQ